MASTSIRSSRTSLSTFGAVIAPLYRPLIRWPAMRPPWSGTAAGSRQVRLPVAELPIGLNELQRAVADRHADLASPEVNRTGYAFCRDGDFQRDRSVRHVEIDGLGQTDGPLRPHLRTSFHLAAVHADDDLVAGETILQIDSNGGHQVSS